MTTTTDASLLVSASASKKKRSFYTVEEDIVIKPSTELIPDEYEHSTNENILFHVFRTPTQPDEELAKDLINCVKDINYKVDAKTNIHSLDTVEQLNANLKTIKLDAVNKNALILVFLGFFGTNDGTISLMEENESVHIKDIWNHFIASNCTELKHKPKVFIFCTSQRAIVQRDCLSFQQYYDFPAESDMLIVYEKQSAIDPINKEDFINQLCFNITNYSKKYDIIDLISYIHEDSHKPLPLIISTLTRKFYLTPSTQRDHHLSIAENHYHLEGILQKLQEHVKKLHEAQKKKKKNEMMRFFNSFRLNKNEDKPVVEKKKKNKSGNKPLVEQRKKSENPPTSSKVTTDAASSTQRASVSSSTGRRSRKPSECAETSTIQKRPAWKN